MTIHEQVALATDKIAHWNSKRDHAQAMLTKWQGRLTALQSNGKSQPTSKKLPPVALVPEVAKEAGDAKVVPIKGKAKGKKPTPPTKKG